MAELKQTPLYSQHQLLNAKIVDFGGWALPVNYGSQIDEHHAVRKHCGVFDVSHMTVSDITGPDTLDFLRQLLANDIGKASNKAGKAIYSCMLNENGGVIDDLIVYHINQQHCRLITNAGTNEKDMAWITKHLSEYQAEIQERPELALIALQGPDAHTQGIQLFEKLNASFDEPLADLTRFQGTFGKIDAQEVFIGRTGYTGEDGFEIVVNAALANQIWSSIIDSGISPCGLGARDTLRLEAGMALYGNDLDEHHTPLESGLSWTVSDSPERSFIGQSALTDPQHKMIGLILKDRGVLRSHQKVHHADAEIGEITSGTFSPSLQQSIALARVQKTASIKVGDEVSIVVRNKKLSAVVAKYPFIKNGQATND